MTVGELKELLSEVEDDAMEVFIGEEENIIGGFIFKPACSIESGVTELGAPEDVDGTGPIEKEIFALMPCGQLCAEENEDEDEDDVLKDSPLPPEVFN